MVGRVAELHLLRDAYQYAESVPAAFVISGEAGIGKTRLILEFSAALPPGSVVSGSCIELGGEPIVFAAIEDVLRQLATPSQAETDREPQDGPTSPDRRLAQFERWARAIEGGDPAGPARLLVIEDLHWADDSTLDFLSYLIRSLRRRRLMVVISRRSDQATLTPAANATLAELLRLPQVVSLALRRLTAVESGQLLAGTDQTLVDRWHHLSGGNPYLLGELVDAGGQISRQVRDVLIDRVRRLEPDAQLLVRVAAVAGAFVDDELLWNAAGLDQLRYVAALRNAIDGGVLHAGPGRYAFRHSLSREAVLDELLPFERRLLHGAIATSLEKTAGLSDAVTSATIAAHWSVAGDRQRTFDASLRAGRQSFEIHAFAEAWHHYNRAVSLLDSAGSSPDPGSLYVAAAEAARWCGQLSSAIELIRRALSEATADGDKATLHERLGLYLWDAGRPGSHDEYRRATELLAQGPPSNGQAAILAAQARISVLLTHYERATEEVSLALEQARRWGLKDVEANAFNTLAVAEFGLGQPDAAVAHLREAMILARDADDFETTCRTYSNLVFVLESAGAHEDAAEAALHGLEALRSRGVHVGVGATLAHNAASVLNFRGRHREAEALLNDLLTLDTSQGRPLLLYMELASAQLRLGRYDSARESLLSAKDVGEIEEPWVMKIVAVVEAELLSVEGRFDQALQLIIDTVQRLDGSEDASLIVELCRLGLQVVADREHAPSRRRDQQDSQAIWLTERLERAAETPAANQRPAMAAGITTARAEERRARRADDWQCWHEAGEQWAVAAFPGEVAYCRLREAEQAASQRRGRQAEQALQEAWRIACELEAQPLVEKAEGLARRAHLKLTSPGSDSKAAEPAPFGLTAREHDVWRLLAHGASNREIAQALFIGERTVESHVSAILRKLNVRTRLEAGLLAQNV